MSYSIFRTNGSLLTTIPDGTVNTTSTPLSLPGRNYASYGQIVDTNFVHQLENFANSTPPPDALRGQLWYNTTANVLYICPSDGESNVALWVPILTPNNISNISVVNLTASANISANNATITNNANANAISTNYLTVNVQANISNANVTGNAVVANLRTVNVTAGSNTITGTLTGAWTVNGDATVSSVANTALYVTGGNLVVSTGIKTNNYLYANGVAVSFDGTYTNSNVAAYLPTYEGNVGSPGGNAVFNGRTLNAGSNVTTGTINGNWTLSSGSQINGLSGIAGANVTGTVANATYAVSAGSAGSATTAATVTTAAQPNITSVGTLTGLNVSGNANFTGQLISLGSNGNVSITGGAAGQVLSTNGSGGLSWVSAAAAQTAITVTANAQPNITSTGTLTGLNVSGNASFTGANVSLGDAANLKINGGSSGQLLTSLGSGTVAWQTAETVIPSGTRMLFAQTNAPTGWTKQTSSDNAALRVVSGTAGTGGSVNFTAAFTSQSVSGTVGSTTAGGTVGNSTISATVGDTAVSGTVGSTVAEGSVGSTSITASIGETAVSGSITSATAGGTVGTNTISASIGNTAVSGTIDETTVTGTTNSNFTGITLNIINSEQIENEQNQFWVYRYAINDPGHSHTFSAAPHNHTFSSPSHSHDFTQSAHGHTFAGSPHSHSFTSPNHTHGFTQTAHNHTFAGSAHTHSFSSPNHTHSFSQSAHTHTFTGDSHNHTFSGTDINLAVKYVDVIIAQKD